MRARFKSHLEQMQRARTSTGRDMLEGWCLDRNERVTEFPDEILAGLYRATAQVYSEYLSRY